MGATHTNRITTFTVTKSNPSGAIVRFTISDTANILTTTKMQRAVQMDALGQFITAESADLVTNGDASLETEYNKMPKDGSKSISEVSFDFENKRMDVTLTATTNIAATGDITATAAFGEV